MARNTNVQPLPDNSKSAKAKAPEERHATAKAKGKVRKNVGMDLLNTFILEDPKDVAQEIWEANIVPGIREAASAAFDAFIYGIGGKSKRSPYVKGGSIVRYDLSSGGNTRSSDDRRDRSDGRVDPGRSRRSARDFRDIEFENKDEANDVLQELFDEAVRYDKVTMAYYYELADAAREMPYTATRYGWYLSDLDGVRTESLHGGGYIINLPKPKYLG